MPTFETPYGVVDAPTEEAAQKWIANKRGAQPQATDQPGGQEDDFQRSSPAPSQDKGPLDAFWHGLVHGSGNVVSGLRQMASRVPGVSGITGENPQMADKAAQQRQQAYEGPFAPGPGKPLSPSRQHPIAAGAGEITGEAAATAPLAALPGGPEAAIMRRVGGAALGSAMGGAAQPVLNKGDYWSQKMMQAGLSGTIGAGLGAAGAVAAPTLSPEARTLAQQGVRMTPGQMMPGTVQAAERTLQAFPIVRGYVQGQVGRSIEDFNRAAVRQALDPIAAPVPSSIKAGHPLMKFATNALDQAYDRIKPHLSLTQQGVAGQIQTNQSLQHLISELPDDLQKRFSTILQNRVLGVMSNAGGTIDGEGFKKIESYLSGRAQSFSGTNDAELGEALNQTLMVLRQELATQNPQFAPELQKINSAYAMFVRLRDAASRRSTSSGTFTPADLLASVKTLDPSAGRGDFARGDALMQVLGEAGQKVLSGSFVNRQDRMRLSDLLIGSIATPGYAAVSAAQKVPGLGRALGIAAPTAGAASARQRQPRDSQHTVDPPPAP